MALDDLLYSHGIISTIFAVFQFALATILNFDIFFSEI